MCGFSEGVVRSWRDGNTDPSRARCVTLAKTLGISLIWLVAGEGTLQIDPTQAGAEQYNSEKVAPPRSYSPAGLEHSRAVNTLAFDAQRLDPAVRVLPSPS